MLDNVACRVLESSSDEGNPKCEPEKPVSQRLYRQTEQ
jgi:hypothetical protein